MEPHLTPEYYDFDKLESTISEVTFIKVTAFLGKWFMIKIKLFPYTCIYLKK